MKPDGRHADLAVAAATARGAVRPVSVRKMAQAVPTVFPGVMEDVRIPSFPIKQVKLRQLSHAAILNTNTTTPPSPDDVPPQQRSPLMPDMEIPTIASDPGDVSDELNVTTSYEFPPFSDMSASHFNYVG